MVPVISRDIKAAAAFLQCGDDREEFRQESLLVQALVRHGERLRLQAEERPDEMYGRAPDAISAAARAIAAEDAAEKVSRAAGAAGITPEMAKTGLEIFANRIKSAALSDFRSSQLGDAGNVLAPRVVFHA